MKATWIRRITPAIILLAALVASMTAAPPAAAAPFDGRRAQFADPAFSTVWSRTDAANVRGGRTWYWGPQPWFDYAEHLIQGVNGLRTVQYFDKARMEINDPNDRSYQGGVTNGLLVVELVSGQMRFGFEGWQIDGRRGPADIPVAGNPKADNPSSPTYASFRGVATVGSDYRDSDRTGQEARASLMIDRDGNLSPQPELAGAHPETELVDYDGVTGHNIPRVFRDFLTLHGLYLRDGRVERGQIIDPIFAMGHPITDAYWVRAKIGTSEKVALVQLYERRVLTYVPDNPAGYQVEMGNVGQHYFQWRYPQLGQPWAVPDPNLPLLYASSISRDGPAQMWMRALNSIPWLELTNESVESTAFSYLRSYDLAQTRVLFDSPRGDGTHRQIYMMEVPPLANDYTRGPVVTRLTYSDGTPPPLGKSPGALSGPGNDESPSASPDGSKIAFVSDRTGVPTLFLMYSDGGGVTPLQLGETCANRAPNWSPDGRKLYWERQCPGGKWVVRRADLAYQIDSNGIISATLINASDMTDQSADNRFPRVSPDGTKVAITSYRDGNAEVYLLDAASGLATRLTNNPADDEGPTWSPDGARLAFSSNRDGIYKIYLMSADGSSQARITQDIERNIMDERWPVWAQ